MHVADAADAVDAAGPAPPPARWARVRSLVAGLDPGSFAFVMATGVVSTALSTHGARSASAALLGLGLAAYAVLLVAYAWRALAAGGRFAADLAGPRGFAFLTVAAASDVLAARLVLQGWAAPAAVLLALGTAAWLGFGYGVPLTLVAGRGGRGALAPGQVNGTWFIWVVGTQSVAVAAAPLAALAPGPGRALGGLAAVCWGIGLVQYLLVAALGLARLLLWPVAPAELIPAYWVFMGAAAIGVLAGARLLELPAADRTLPSGLVAGVALVLWSFCSWLIPLLLALGFWRHVVRRVPLRYQTGLWSMVFPLAMYGVAGRELGRVTGTRWLEVLGGAESWVACGVWAAVFAGMLAAGAGALRPGRHRPAGPAAGG